MKLRRRVRSQHALALLVVGVIVAAGAVALTSRSSGSPAGPAVTDLGITVPKVHVVKPKVTRLDRLARLGLPLYCGGGNLPLVALTFDDGPGPYSRRIIRILRSNHAQATFFLVGNRVPMYTHLPGEEQAVGAVGNHSWSHAHLVRLDRKGVARELDDTITELAGVGVAVRLFRPPYEEHTPAIDRAVAHRKLLQVLWSKDGGDTDPKLTPAKLARRIASDLRPGSIVVLHDIRPRTAEALPLLLRAMRKRGLRAVSVPELVRLDPPSRARLTHGLRGCG